MMTYLIRMYLSPRTGSKI